MKTHRLLILAAFLVPGLSGAATLSQWTFNDASLAASNVSAGFEADAMTFGTFGGSVGTGFPAVAGVGGSVAFVLPVYHSDSGYQLKNSVSTALAANHIFQFQMGATAGNTATFSALSFYAWGNANLPDGETDQYHFFVQSSRTGSTVLGTFSSNYQTGTAPASGSALYQLNLAGIPELQNVEGDVTFTVGLYTTNPTTAGNLRIDSVQIEGTVAPIPEPASLALLSVGVLGFAGRRRR